MRAHFNFFKRNKTKVVIKVYISSLVFLSGHFKTELVKIVCLFRPETCTAVGRLAAGVPKSFFSHKFRKHGPIKKIQTVSDSTLDSASFDMLFDYIALIMRSRCGAVTSKMRNFKGL